MKDVFFFFDDSGVLTNNEPSGYFVYAGYVFTSDEERTAAKHKYIRANKELKKELNIQEELKASRLEPKQKRSLYNVLRKYSSVSASVEISRVYPHIMASKKSRCRYKDYVIKMCVKRKLNNLIKDGVLSKEDDVHIHVYVDEQLTATNGYYDLRDSIVEELQYGIISFNYGTKHPPVFSGEVKVSLEYCDSKRNFLIQASDILANRIWTSFRVDNPKLRDIPNHLHLTFP